MTDFSTEDDQVSGGMNAVYLSVKGQPLLQIFILSYQQKNHCTLLGSPSEKGLQQFDNKVRQPSVVQFTGIVKAPQKAVFNGLRLLMKSNTLKDILCVFQTKAGEIKNMIIDSLEEVGESQRYDGIEMRCSLTEYLEHNVNGDA